MTEQAKQLKQALKTIKAKGPYKLSVRTHINYHNGDVGRAWSIIYPLTTEQEKHLIKLLPYVKILKDPDNPNHYWAVEY